MSLRRKKRSLTIRHPNPRNANISEPLLTNALNLQLEFKLKILRCSHCKRWISLWTETNHQKWIFWKHMRPFTGLTPQRLSRFREIQMEMWVVRERSGKTLFADWKSRVQISGTTSVTHYLPFPSRLLFLGLTFIVVWSWYITNLSDFCFFVFMSFFIVSCYCHSFCSLSFWKDER